MNLILFISNEVKKINIILFDINYICELLAPSVIGCKFDLINY